MFGLGVGEKMFGIRVTVVPLKYFSDIFELYICKYVYIYISIYTVYIYIYIDM